MIKWFGFIDKKGCVIWLQSESAILDVIKKKATNKVIKINDRIYKEEKEV